MSFPQPDFGKWACFCFGTGHRVINTALFARAICAKILPMTAGSWLHGLLNIRNTCFHLSDLNLLRETGSYQKEKEKKGRDTIFTEKGLVKMEEISSGKKLFASQLCWKCRWVWTFLTKMPCHVKTSSINERYSEYSLHHQFTHSWEQKLIFSLFYENISQNGCFNLTLLICTTWLKQRARLLVWNVLPMFYPASWLIQGMDFKFDRDERCSDMENSNILCAIRFWKEEMHTDLAQHFQITATYSTSSLKALYKVPKTFCTEIRD